MSEPALFPEFFPGPDFVGGLVRQRETELMGQHAYLAAMMGIMHDHVGEHGGAAGPRSGPAVAAELLDATRRAVQGFCEHLRAAQRAFRQRGSCLLLRAAGAIELLWKLEMRGREPEPLAADVVYMGEYRRDRARLAAGRFCPPGARMEMLEDELVHSVIDGVGLEQRVAKIRGGQSRGASHGISPDSVGGIQSNAELWLRRVAGAPSQLSSVIHPRFRTAQDQP